MRHATKAFAWIVAVALIGFALPAVASETEGGKKPVAMTPDQMKWVPVPNTPGVMTAVVWGDPETGAHGAFHKFVAGFRAPLHTHTANTRIVVISGTMAMIGKDGKEMKFPAGSYYTQPNTLPHVTKCMEGSECLVFLQANGKWDLKPVVAGK